MRRVALILATLGILCVAAGQVQAHGYHHGHAYYGGYYGAVVVRPPVVIAPPVVVAPPIYPTYYPRCYYSAPSYGFYYQGRGLSIGVGF